MRYSEFWDLVEEVFGQQMGRTLAADQVIGALDDRTCVQALTAGLEPQVIWRALCDAMAVPEAERWGPQLRRTRQS